MTERLNSPPLEQTSAKLAFSKKKKKKKKKKKMWRVFPCIFHNYVINIFEQMETFVF